MFYWFNLEKYWDSFISLGLLPLNNEDIVRKRAKMILLRLFLNFGLLVFLVTSHLRIVRFRRHYNNSYFSTFRQNIATSHQTIIYAYSKCIFQIAKAIIIKMTNNYNHLYIDITITFVGKCP